jgi:hypothetical protein
LLTKYLYYLNYEFLYFVTHCSHTHGKLEVFILQWHFKLGHPSLDIVQRVVKEKHLPVSEFDFNKTSACISCQLGKSKRQPLHASNHVTLQPLELIHSNIWTSPIQSINGCKYHVIFIDDFSRYTWIYPLS